MGSFSAADDVISFTVSNYDAGSHFPRWLYTFTFTPPIIIIDQNIDHN